MTTDHGHTDFEYLSCRELVELVTDYVEGLLDERHRRLFEQHVHDCNGCSGYVEQMRETIRATGTLAEADISPEAERALLDAFSGWAGT